MKGRIDKTIALISMGDDFDDEGTIEYIPIKTYDSIALALDALYDLYVSTAQRAQFEGVLTYTEIGQCFDGQWHFTIMEKMRDRADGLCTRAKIDLIDLITE